MTNSDKHDNLFRACAFAKFSDKALNTKKELTQTSNETNWSRSSFGKSLAGCLENNIKL